MAGESAAVGQDVERFRVGDQVFASTGLKAGAHAEYVCLPEDAMMAEKPANLTYEQAAAVPIGGNTALYLLKQADIQSGQKVLIYGASGSMGTYAVQLARHFGAEVTGVDSGGKLDLMRSLGADHVIDYTREDYTRTGKRHALILDVAAYRSVFDYSRALTPDGIFMIVGGSFRTLLQVVILGTLISRLENKRLGINAWEPNKREDLALPGELFEAGKVVPVIDKRYALHEVPDAFQYPGDGQALGKLVVVMCI